MLLLRHVLCEEPQSSFTFAMSELNASTGPAGCSIADIVTYSNRSKDTETRNSTKILAADDTDYADVSTISVIRVIRGFVRAVVRLDQDSRDRC